MLRHREKSWRKYELEHQWTAFKSELSKYNKLIFEFKSQYIRSKVCNYRNDTKKLYGLITELTGAKRDSPLPEHNLDQDLAEHFASFFTDKMTSIRNNNLFEPPLTMPPTS